MNRLIRNALLVILTTAFASACDSFGSAPSLEDLRAEYGMVAEGRFEVYDAESKATLTGSAVLDPADCPPPVTPADVCLSTDDLDMDGFPLSVIKVNADELLSAVIGDEFDVSVGYVSDRHDFSSTEGRAAVTAVSEDGMVSAVFWAVVRPEGIYRTRRLVIEGGFNAVPDAP